ncbi:MAG: aldehyde reductase [Myxococcota bacterium]
MNDGKTAPAEADANESEDPNTITVLLTGASGFVGMHCIVQLLDAGYRVRGTLRTMSRADEVRKAIARQTEHTDRLDFVRANLLQDEGWSEAADGCTYVMHVASPLPRKPPKHEDELIVPARDGALRVLEAAIAAGVKRVVMTSSVAAILYGHVRDGSKIFDEDDWSLLNDELGAYEKSKTIAERAAWDRMTDGDEPVTTELVTINPGLVLGPVLNDDFATSGEVVRKLMKRELPGCPDMHWPVVDVRDVAAAHLAAMTAPAAAGRRFACTNGSTTMHEIAQILDRHFAERGYRIPTRKLPNWLVRLAAIFDKTTRLIVPDLGKRQDVSNTRIIETLDWQPRSVEEMVVSMGESMIEHGVV